MEKTDAAAVVPLDAGWCDVGSWTALWEISAKKGNACKGDVLALDTRNSLIMADSRLVATLGIEGQVHALENPGTIPLELIEVQSGSYLGEDDIVRLEDRYGRVE